MRSSIVQNEPDLSDAVVQALVKFDKSGIAPNGRAQLFARNDLTSPFKQHAQNAQRLGLNLDTAVLTKELSGKGIEFEIAETQPSVAAAVHPGVLSLQ
jgi:hypothetical protein